MAFQITLSPQGITFAVETGEPILDAALNQGINLSYGCRNGACGACKVQVLSGEVSYPEDPIALSDEDKEQSNAYLCFARAESDLEIKAEVVQEISDIEVKTLPCRVHKLEKLTQDVMYMALKLPSTERIQFLPGQYIDILLEDGQHRSFSLANPPHHDEYLELHVRHVEGGKFTDKLFSHMKEMDILRIEGPHGSFFYHEESSRPIIFMAGGTGFAPIKSIIEHLLAEKITVPIYLYWGARSESDLYMDNVAKQWAEENSNINYIPVLSDIDEADNSWSGRKGFVHQAICDDFDDLSNYDIYTCGPPIMIKSGEQAFKEKGMESSHFFFDSFDYAVQK